jgi:hypothetical protein
MTLPPMPWPVDDITQPPTLSTRTEPDADAEIRHSQLWRVDTRVTCNACTQFSDVSRHAINLNEGVRVARMNGAPVPMPLADAVDAATSTQAFRCGDADCAGSVTIERAHGPQLLMLEFAHGAHTNVADSIQRSTVIAGNLLFMGGSYTVCGLLYHTANRGHYVAELLHADGWHHYDDLLESTVPIAAPRAALNSPKGSLLLLLGALFERR